MLTEAQIQRYARHILMPEVGGKGQERLLAARAVVSARAELGDLAVRYLRAAGVVCTVELGAGLRIEVAGVGGVEVTHVEGGDLRVRATPHPPAPPPEGEVSDAKWGQEPGQWGIAASLAASEALLLVLGVLESERLWRVRPLGIERVAG